MPRAPNQPDTRATRPRTLEEERALIAKLRAAKLPPGVDLVAMLREVRRLA